MRKKLRYLKKILAILLCFVSVLGHVKTVMAEDVAQPLLEKEIFKLSGYPLVTQQSEVGFHLRYLRLGKEDKGQSEMYTPFGDVLKFPFVELFYDENKSGLLPSTYLLDILTREFHYVEWDLEDVPDLQLKEYPGYILHVGNATGEPTRARWGIRKTGAGPYDDFPVEHTLEYLNGNDEWVAVYSRKMRWAPQQGKDESWGGGSIEHYDDIYWESVQTTHIDNVSPLVEGVSPEPAKSVDKNNTGTIEDILFNRTGELGQVYDLTTDISVSGAVTKQFLTPTNKTPIPSMHFYIEHDVEKISHLIKDGVYTGIGIGTVTSKVTDYEDDATIFTQEVIVSTKGSPGVNIYRAGTNTLYEKEWMSNDKSADRWRQRGLDIEANSTINGKYDLVTRVADVEAKRWTVTKSNEEEIVKSERIYGHTNEDTTEEGIKVTSIAYLEGDSKKTLSAESEAKYMRSDSVVPTISKVEFAGEWEEMISHDANDDLSGLNENSGGVHYLFVKRVEGKDTEGIVTPTDDSDWRSLEKDYQLPEVGEYDLYVYAKDNATNRSKPLRLNDTPIIIRDKSPAKVRLEKTVAGNEGNNADIFVIHLEEKSTMLGSVALKCDETSGWMNFDMSQEAFRTIKVTEVVPMDYSKEYRIYITDGEGKITVLDDREDEITIKANDEITITIENEFEHTGYFRDKVAVENVFWRLL